MAHFVANHYMVGVWRGNDGAPLGFCGPRGTGHGWRGHGSTYFVRDLGAILSGIRSDLPIEVDRVHHALIGRLRGKICILRGRNGVTPRQQRNSEQKQGLSDGGLDEGKHFLLNMLICYLILLISTDLSNTE